MSAEPVSRPEPPRRWEPRVANTPPRLPLTELLDVVRLLHATLDLSVTLNVVAQEVARACGFGGAVVNLLVEDRYEVVAVAGTEEARRAQHGTSFLAADLADLLSYGQRCGEVCFIHHDDLAGTEVAVPMWVPPIQERLHPDAWHPLDMLFVPLTDATGEQVGILSVDVPLDGLVPTRDQVELLEVFAHHAGIAIEHARLHAELEKQRQQLDRSATIDHLTGLRNRTVFDREVPTLMTQRGREVVVLVLDLDGFKAVNDEGGHHVGDVVLSTVASRMRATMREGDVLARTGGDEFVVVAIADDAHEQAAVMSRRLQEVVREPVVIDGHAWRVGVSIGAATSTTPADADELLVAADAAMYDAKRTRARAPSTWRESAS